MENDDLMSFGSGPPWASARAFWKNVAEGELEPDAVAGPTIHLVSAILHRLAQFSGRNFVNNLCVSASLHLA
jgi:hypothetical protein